MPEHTEREIAQIRGLFHLYKEVRHYSYKDLQLKLKEHGISGDPGHLSRLQNDKTEWPGLSLELAQGLHAVLGFGELRPGDEEWALREADYETWMQATHLGELHEKLMDARTEHEGQKLFALTLKLLLPRDSSRPFAGAWGKARFRALRLGYADAKPLYGQTVYLANLLDADHRLLGIIHHDYAGICLATSDLKGARSQVELCEGEFSTLKKQGFGHELNVRVGLARIPLRRFEIAVWDGTPVAACEALFSHALELAKSIPDYYGWAELLTYMGYLSMLEEDPERGRSFSLQAREVHGKAKLFHRDPYWQIRDGGFLGSEWATLHINAAIADFHALLGAPAASDMLRQTLLLRLREQLLVRPWARQLPPMTPFYAWKLELQSGVKSRSDLAVDVRECAAELERLGYTQMLVLALVAAGDFFHQEIGDRIRAEECYVKALDHCQKRGFDRPARYTSRRLEALGNHS